MKKILILISVIVVLCVGVFLGMNQKTQTEVLNDGNLKSNTEETQTATSTSLTLAGSWMWQNSTTQIGGTISPPNPNKFVINFTEEGRLSSTTDCNNIAGSFIKNEEVISIGQLVSTEMACEGDILEAKYAEQLSLASSYSIKDNVLTIILVKDAGKMNFIRQ